MQMKRKQDRDPHECETQNLIINHRHQVDVGSSLPEKLIESLDDSQEQIKDEEIQRETLPEIDEFNEFSEPEDMMEDLRKEVEKVVETIADNDCLREATWNYQVTEEMDENDEQAEDLQIYSTTELIQNNVESSIDSHYEEIDNVDNVDNNEIVPQEDTRNFDSDFDEEDEEDDKPLEQVRQSLQKSTKDESDSKKIPSEDDKEDLELTECLKKIHNFKCTACNKAFNSRTALGYHLKTHTTGKTNLNQNRSLLNLIFLKYFQRGAMSVIK